MRNDYSNRPRPSLAPKGKGPGGLKAVGGHESILKGSSKIDGASKSKTKGKIV